MGGGGEAPDPRPAADAQRYAAKLQYDAAMQQIEAWKEYNQQVREDFQPYREYGLRILDEMEAGFGFDGRYGEGKTRWSLPDFQFETEIPEFGGYQTELPELSLPEWDPDTFVFEEDPGYQFRLDEGLKAVRRGMNASGMRGSGATMKALTEYGQGFASNEYDRARQRAINDYMLTRQNAVTQYGADYGRAQDLRGAEMAAHLLERDRANMMRSGEVLEYDMQRRNVIDDYNRLAAQLGVGQVATGEMARYGAGAQSAMSNLHMTGASALASGHVGAANLTYENQMAEWQARQNRFNNILGVAGAVVGGFAGPEGMAW